MENSVDNLQPQNNLQSMQKKLIDKKVKFDWKNINSPFGKIRLLLIVSLELY